MPWGGIYFVQISTGSGLSDVTEDVREIVVNRGRSSQLDEFTAGVCTLTIVDTTRKYDPQNTSSPYYNLVTNTSGVTIGKRVIVSCLLGDPVGQTRYIFTGFITDINTELQSQPQGSPLAIVTIECADAFSTFASIRLEEYTPTPELTDERITTLLALPEVNYPDPTFFQPGTVTAQDEIIPEQTILLDALQDVARTEYGYFFVDPEGILIFKQRLPKLVDEGINVSEYYPDGSSIQIVPFVFGDTGTRDASYDSLSIVYGKERMFNRIICNPVGSIAPSTAEDATSITRYGVSTLTVDGIVCDDPAAQDLADYLLDIYKEPNYTIDSVGVTLNIYTEAQQLYILDQDLADIVVITKTYSIGAPTSLRQVSSIEGISHVITPTTHKVMFRFGNRSVLSVLTLDDALLGQLDRDNIVLG